MSEELVERVARVLASANGFDPDEICDNHTPTCPGPVWRLYQGTAKAAVAIALEEAAKACEAELVGSFDQYSLGYNDGCKENAAAIRGMMEKKDA